MTSEETRIHIAATDYSASPNEANFARLITAVMDLPLQQWPEGACSPEPKPHKAKAFISPFIVQDGLRLTEGDAAYPDKIRDLETGKKE